MSDVSNDARERNWSNYHPNNVSIRAFRARNLDLTFINSENKEAVNLRGERFSHVYPFFSILEAATRALLSAHFAP